MSLDGHCQSHEMTLAKSSAAQYVGPRAPTIFISYRRQEASYLAGWLHDSLALNFGAANVFLDIDSIKPGMTFFEAIDQAITDLTILLVLIGPNWSTVNTAGRSRIYDE